MPYSTDNVSLHLKNIYAEHELEEPATTEDFSVVRQEGQREVKRKLKHYNLDAIISVGYRVNSARATQFRIWATRTLKQHLVAGYDEESLKQLSSKQTDMQGLALADALAAIAELKKNTHRQGRSHRAVWPTAR